MTKVSNTPTIYILSSLSTLNGTMNYGWIIKLTVGLFLDWSKCWKHLCICIIEYKWSGKSLKSPAASPKSNILRQLPSPSPRDLELLIPTSRIRLMKLKILYRPSSPLLLPVRLPFSELLQDKPKSNLETSTSPESKAVTTWATGLLEEELTTSSMKFFWMCRLRLISTSRNSSK